jgi:hypothetical protein
MRRIFLCAVLFLVALHTSAATPVIDNTCDISASPAATLLLPYFEVEVGKPVSDAANTIFTVVNTSQQPQLARVTIWTDYGYPVMWFTLFLTGYDAKPISLYDVLMFQQVPATSPATTPGSRSAPNDSNARISSLQNCGTGAVPPAIAKLVNAALTTGTIDDSNCAVGGNHAMATGYVTIDVVTNCSNISPLDPVYYSQTLSFDNVLTGDYEHVYPDRSVGNFAGGSPLVHIKAIPAGGNANVATTLPYTFYDRFTPNGGRRVDRRQPLPSSFASRFIQGGPTAFTTDFVFWREGVGAAAAGVCSASASSAMPLATIVRFDEFENPTIVASNVTSPVTQSISTSSQVMPPLSGQSLTGWMYIDLDNRGDATAAAAQSRGRAYSNPNRTSQNWVVVRMRAEGRYGVDYDATTLRNACAAAATVAPAVNAAKK